MPAACEILRRKVGSARIHRSDRRDGEFASERFDGYVEKRGNRLTYVVRAKDFRAWFAGDSVPLKLILECWAEKTIACAVRSLEFADPFAD